MRRRDGGGAAWDKVSRFGTILLALAALACAGEGPAERAAFDGPIRLIDAEPALSYDPQQAFPWRVETIARWDFRDPVEVRTWELFRADLQAESTALGLQLETSHAWMTVHKPVRLDAARITSIEVELAGIATARRRLMLQWAMPGQPFSIEQQVELAVAAGVETRFRFPLAGHPRWRGSITALRLGIAGAQQQALVLREIVAFERTLLSDEIDATALGPYKVDLDHEVRNAMLALPDLPLELAIEVPAAVLEMAYGVRGAGEVELRIELVAEDESSAAVTIFRQRLSEPDQDRWHDVRVDLEPWAGRRGRLRFTAEYPDGFSPDRSAFWAHPKIVPRQRRSDAPPDVVLISIDTLRADHLSLYGYERATSPHIDAFAAERGVVFDNVVAAASSTKVSHASIFTGLDAHRHGVQKGVVPADLELLSERLHAAGYATVGVTGGGRVHPRYGFSQGFERYRYFTGSRRDELDDHLERALTLLDSASSQPLFLFFHTYEVHAPYRPRQPYYDRFGGRELSGEITVTHLGDDDPPPHWRWVMQDDSGQKLPERPFDEVRRLVIDAYDSSIAHVDRQLARLLARLDERRSQALVIVTSDHGEAFGEGGRVTHGFLDDSNLMVPLVIALPGGRAAGLRIERQVRSVDLLPTILDLLELALPADIDGVSLRPLLEGGEVAVPREAWSYVSNRHSGLALRLGNRLKYTFNDSVAIPPERREGLYDLRRDRDETVDLSSRFDTSSLRRRATAELQQTPGLWLVVQNRGARELTLELLGAAVSGSRLNAWQLPLEKIERCCDGHLAIAVLPGERYDLHLDAAPEDRFQLLLKLGGDTFERADFQLERAEKLVIAHRSEGWGERTGESGPPAVGVAMEWRGRVASSALPGVDPELRRQLEALGYVD